jgi:hypothetical protein
MSPVTYSLLASAARGKSTKLNGGAFKYSAAAVKPDLRPPSSADESMGQHSLQSGTEPVKLITYLPLSSGPSSLMSNVGSDPHSPFVTAASPFSNSGIGNHTYDLYLNWQVSMSLPLSRISTRDSIPFPRRKFPLASVAGSNSNVGLQLSTVFMYG